MASRPPLDAVDQLSAVQEITRLMNRYAFFVDAHDWDGFASLFAADAELDEADLPVAFRGDTGSPVSEEVRVQLEKVADATSWPIVGRAAIRDQMIKIRPEHSMFHHVFNPDVEVLTGSAAEGRFYYEAHHWLPEGGPVRRMHNFGIYHGVYRRGDDRRWQIQSLRLQRRRVECY